MKNQKVWLITCGSKAMGLELARYALSLDHSVAATSCSIKDFRVTIAENQDNCLPLPRIRSGEFGTTDHPNSEIEGRSFRLELTSVSK